MRQLVIWNISEAIIQDLMVSLLKVNSVGSQKPTGGINMCHVY